MKKSAFLIVVTVTMLLSTAAWAEETPANQQIRPQTERPRARVQNLTPEERAKLREKWQNMSEQERAQFRARMREQLSADRPRPEAAQRVFANELAAFKKQYELTRGELQAIRQLAIKEKATQTARALEKLIARNEEDYQRRLKQLEQRQQRLQAARQERGQQMQGSESGEQSKPADTPQRESGRQRQRGNATRSRQ